MSAIINPSSGGGGGAPSGPAGGSLGGTYPNPTVLKVGVGDTVVTAAGEAMDGAANAAAQTALLAPVVGASGATDGTKGLVPVAVVADFNARRFLGANGLFGTPNPFVDGQPSWTYTASALSNGEFTANNADSVVTTSITLSKTVIGTYAQAFAGITPGSVLVLAMSTTGGLDITSHAYPITGVTDDGNGNPVFALGSILKIGNLGGWANLGSNVAFSIYTPGIGVNIYALAYAASLTPNAALYNNRGIIRITGWNGALTLNPPTNGVDGQKVEFWATAVGGSRALTFNAALIFPSLFTPTSPITILTGDKIKIGLTFDATLNQWEVDMDLSSF